MYLLLFPRNYVPGMLPRKYDSKYCQVFPLHSHEKYQILTLKLKILNHKQFIPNLHSVPSDYIIQNDEKLKENVLKVCQHYKNKLTATKFMINPLMPFTSQRILFYCV